MLIIKSIGAFVFHINYNGHQSWKCWVFISLIKSKVTLPSRYQFQENQTTLVFFKMEFILKEESLTNLLKTAVSVLASTVRLTVSFMEPLMTVSVMLRCSQHDGWSFPLNFSPYSSKAEEEAAALITHHASPSVGYCYERWRLTGHMTWQS